MKTNDTHTHTHKFQPLPFTTVGLPIHKQVRSEHKHSTMTEKAAACNSYMAFIFEYLKQWTALFLVNQFATFHLNIL